MATRPNWGKGRNLRVKIFLGTDNEDVSNEIKTWFLTLADEEILDMKFTCDTFGSPAEHHIHVIFLYTEE